MSSGAKAFVGVDLGTTSLAAVVTDGRGKALETFSAPNPSAGEPTADGRHEQDAEAIFKVADGLLNDCVAFARRHGRTISKIGWTGQMHGLVAVDRTCRAITPFVTWRDRRAAPPQLGAGILADWRAHKVKGIYRVLTLPGYAIARRTDRYLVDATFRASMGTAEQLRPYARWLPKADDTLMLGDNQAGVYAALKLKPHAAVVNLGTSGQLSIVVAGADGLRLRHEGAAAEISVRPFPGGRALVCRASHVGGAALAELRRSLGFSWQRLNDEALTHPRIASCVDAIIDDLARGIDLKGIRTVVGIGNALRLNPCLRQALERRLHVRCIVPEVKEMAAWGAALYVLDHRCRQESVL